MLTVYVMPATARTRRARALHRPDRRVAEADADRIDVRALLARLADPRRPDIEAARLAIVVAHPDDEIIGCGAALSRMPNVQIVIVTDDEDRENEGDLICAAELATPTMINFMLKFGRGMMCAPVTEERAQRLGLSAMVQVNRDIYGTNYTVTVDAAVGVTTGVSASDRAHTIGVLANPVGAQAAG